MLITQDSVGETVGGDDVGTTDRVQIFLEEACFSVFQGYMCCMNWGHQNNQHSSGGVGERNG